MGHKLDFLERLRFWFARRIGKLVTGVSHRELSADEFVGYVEMGEEEFEAKLHEMGFYRNPLAYWKTSKNYGGEEGSWRWVEGDYQLHVMIFDGHPQQDSPDADEPRTYVFAHWEYRWDRYPMKHLNGPQWRPKGVNMMRKKLNLASIPFYDDPTVQ